MHKILLRCLTFALFAAPFAAPAQAQSDAAWNKAIQDYKDDFKKKSIKFKRRAILSLPLDDPRVVEFVIDKEKLFNSKDWYIRFTAAERLSKIKSPEIRKQLLTYADHRDKRVRECLFAALAVNRDPKLDPPVIVKGLSDSAWEVRRMACWAAGQQRVREAVEPMIGMIHEVGRDGRVVQEGETNPRVHGVLLYNLEEVTGKYFHTDVAGWKLYWERNKDRELPPVKRYDVGNFGDIELKFNDTFARRGTGPLVIVLPQPNKLCSYYMPYFTRWQFCKWLYINLPPVTSFPDVKYNEHNDPIYPVDLLVDAFEEARKKYNVEKCAVMAQGFSCWVAAKYAQRYPDRVSGLMLLNPYASGETYSKRIEEALRSGDPDDEFWAKVSSYQLKAATVGEGEVYSYFTTSATIQNQSDIEVGMLRRVWRDPSGTSIAIPPFDIRGDNTSKTPALMFFARKNNKLTGYDDIKRLKRFYPRNITVKLNKSARLPFMEEPEKFEEALRLFVDKYLQ